jgi:hypothetical protein
MTMWMMRAVDDAALFFTQETPSRGTPVSGAVGCTTVWIELSMDDAHEAQARAVVAGATESSLVEAHPADGRTPAHWAHPPS